MNFDYKNSYYLTLMTTAFMVGEIAHFLIGVVTTSVGKEIGYGDFACFSKDRLDEDTNSTENTCKQQTSQETCLNISDTNGTQICEYLHSGQGLEYLILAGPTFVVIFTVSGIVNGILSDRFSRTKLLSICVMLFSVGGLLIGFATKYWHLVILRMAIAAGESACRPASGSIIAELFDPTTRGVANGIFSWGVYIGYGLTFVIGNYLAPANLLGYGWRACFVVGCAPGIVISILLFFLNDPREFKKESPIVENTAVEEVKLSPNDGQSYWMILFKASTQPANLLLLIAAAIRHTAGYSWAYNTQIFLNEYYPDYNPGLWLAMCSIFGGSLGDFFGGFLSDRVVKMLGIHSRLWILSVSTLIAAPLAAGVLTAGPPTTFYFLMAYYFFAETWFSILFTVLVEIVPPEVRSGSLAFFLFMMNNVGGNLPLLVAPVTNSINLRTALYIFYPGCVALSGLMFFASSVPLWLNHKKSKSQKIMEK